MLMVVLMNKSPAARPLDPRVVVKHHKHVLHPDRAPILDMISYVVTMDVEPTHDQLAEMGVPIAAIPAEVKNHLTAPKTWTFAVRAPAAAGTSCWFCKRESRS